MTDSEKLRPEKTKLVGFNHVAIEVGDIDEALAFYGKLFGFELRSREPGMAFIDLGDQFLALQEVANPSDTGGRHFGLVVEDKQAARAAIEAAGITIEPGPFLDFRDPWGNLFQIVDYRDVQFERTEGVKRALGIEGLEKTGEARREIEENGLG